MKRIRIVTICGFLLMAGIWGCSHSVPSTPPRMPPAGTPPAPSPPSGVPAAPKPYKVMGQWYQPLPDARGFKQTGIASWYGEDFHGKKTSSGEIYDMNAETAAHKTLPLGTVVRVRNVNNSREMEIRINDRGPFVNGRIIDLSYACAKKLGVVGPGTAPVEIVAVGATAAAASSITDTKDFFYKGNFTIQVGAFSDRGNAEKLKAKLEKNYQNAHIHPYEHDSGIFYQVRVLSCTTLEQAGQYKKLMISNGYQGAFAVAE